MAMLLTVIRDYIGKDYTGGVLLIDAKEFCRTIEPPMGWASGVSKTHQELGSQMKRRSPDGINGNGVVSPRQSGDPTTKGCIPMGWYKIQVSYSQKFKRVMPLLELVPGFSGIRIHAGLKVENTQGCICVGVRANEDRLTEILTKAQERNEEIWICITTPERYAVELPKQLR